MQNYHQNGFAHSSRRTARPSSWTIASFVARRRGWRTRRCSSSRRGSAPKTFPDTKRRATTTFKLVERGMPSEELAETGRGLLRAAVRGQPGRTPHVLWFQEDAKAVAVLDAALFLQAVSDSATQALEPARAGPQPGHAFPQGTSAVEIDGREFPAISSIDFNAVIAPRGTARPAAIARPSAARPFALNPIFSGPRSKTSGRCRGRWRVAVRGCRRGEQRRQDCGSARLTCAPHCSACCARFINIGPCPGERPPCWPCSSIQTCGTPSVFSHSTPSTPFSIAIVHTAPATRHWPASTLTGAQAVRRPACCRVQDIGRNACLRL